MKILLASQSPRRKELLSSLGFDFEVVKIDCEEILPDHIKIGEAAAYLSELKANAFRILQKDEVLLTADTVVAHENQVLGKPKDEMEAREMLQSLSGKIHQVYTGITIKTLDKIITETDVADVEFDEITSEEIDFYIKNYKPFDKAGSYGIQEWLGMAKIKNINGSFYTIMGLPTHLVYKILKEL
ncbi:MULTISPECIES: Maf family nucleotide pyrophosphatase [Chryseobacterium]|uniref:dTTP/UTP pyrophosphatase n=1 Tax=Chryseobacterium balustinum TaxID=246 RepID=A0AAX2II43_9FLAO|nr:MULTISPECIES: Maf family nucleotide pyrophosphatase [Chryseobacterium]AZB31387.1 septum formation protein Maf [Chryseobacterium balustinum]OBW39794.1 Septum formation protein Maf [Chryseobacterium sp. MOF25P]OBW44956.1 Septum formation protein Maf [Chryseobacterium sp. BGARF1]SKB35609.1 septum formation protein [Chryseobacterium balustinum]SQA88117.1 Septum formation protein Maf [Chryseobacterium balustinum]